MKTCFEKQAFQPIIKNETTTVRQVTSFCSCYQTPPYLCWETSTLAGGTLSEIRDRISLGQKFP